MTGIYRIGVFFTFYTLIMAMKTEEDKLKNISKMYREIGPYIGLGMQLAVTVTIMVFLVVVILKFLEINEISFIFSLLFFYFLYVTIEIIYLNLRKS